MVDTAHGPIASDYFASDDERDVIVLTKGGRVEVRQSLDAAQRAKFQRSLMSLELDVKTQQMTLKDMAWESQSMLLCRAYVIDWNLGKPYSQEALNGLRPEVLDEIAAAIDKLQEQRRETTEKKE